MIHSFSVKNFKNLNMEPIELYPLTILSGINNAGKTTFIQAILELAKYREGQIELSALPILSNYTTKVFNHQIDNPIEFSLSMKKNEHESINFYAKFEYSRKIKGGFPSHYNISTIIDKKILNSLLLSREDPSLPFDVKATRSLNLIHGKLKKNINAPENFQGKGDFSFFGYIPYFGQFFFKENPQFNQWLEKDKNNNKDSIRVAIPLGGELSDILLNIKYIGPLRKHPEEFYFLQKRGFEISENGDNTIEVLDRLQDTYIDYYQNLEDKKPTKASLLEALKYWLEFFFGNVELTLHSVAENLMQVLINGHTINNSGFGFSQLLPIIIQSLLLKTNQILLLEQPEIHLHPDLELKLAYFLLCITKNDRQIIAETHSEHIINQLVLSKMKDESVDKLFRIYFLDKNNNSEITNFRPIEISNRGEIKNWPKGFFDQYLQFSKELVQLRKAMALKGID